MAKPGIGPATFCSLFLYATDWAMWLSDNERDSQTKRKTEKGQTQAKPVREREREREGGVTTIQRKWCRQTRQTDKGRQIKQK